MTQTNLTDYQSRLKLKQIVAKLKLRDQASYHYLLGYYQLVAKELKQLQAINDFDKKIELEIKTKLAKASQDIKLLLKPR